MSAYDFPERPLFHGNDPASLTVQFITDIALHPQKLYHHAKTLISFLGTELRPKSIFKRSEQFITHLDEVFEHSPWHWTWFIVLCILFSIELACFCLWLASPGLEMAGHTIGHWLLLYPISVFCLTTLVSYLCWGLWSLWMWMKKLYGRWRRMEMPSLAYFRMRGFGTSGYEIQSYLEGGLLSNSSSRNEEDEEGIEMEFFR